MSIDKSPYGQEKDSAWDEFVATHRPGTVVRGMVNQINSHSVTVEIAPEIMGVLPLEEIAPLAVETLIDILWPGDIVEAIVTDLDLSAKRIQLSTKQLISQRVGEIGSAASHSERERFFEMMNLSNSLDSAIYPDTSEWPFGRIC